MQQALAASRHHAQPVDLDQRPTGFVKQHQITDEQPSHSLGSKPRVTPTTISSQFEEAEPLQADWHIYGRIALVVRPSCAEDLEARVEQTWMQAISVGSLLSEGQPNAGPSFAGAPMQLLDPAEMQSQAGVSLGHKSVELFAGELLGAAGEHLSSVRRRESRRFDRTARSDHAFAVQSPVVAIFRAAEDLHPRGTARLAAKDCLNAVVCAGIYQL